MSISESEKLSLRQLVVQWNQDHLEAEITGDEACSSGLAKAASEHRLVWSATFDGVNKHEPYWNVHLEQALQTWSEIGIETGLYAKRRSWVNRHSLRLIIASRYLGRWGGQIWSCVQIWSGSRDPWDLGRILRFGQDPWILVWRADLAGLDRILVWRADLAGLDRIWAGSWDFVRFSDL